MIDEDNTVTVNVKWMSKQYNDLKMCLSEPLETFKVQLWSLTGVPPERQKIMFKGIIPNDADLNKIKITNGSKLMLIGSADKPPECTEKVRFFEELSTVEKAQLFQENKIKKLPPGIMNLGNTCYFNSVVQFLFPVSELWNHVSKCVGTDNSQEKTFAKSLLDMKNQLSFTLERYVPLVQIQNLRKINPLFCRRDEKTGLYMQQDAEECLNCVLNNLNGLSDEKISEKVFGFSLIAKTEPVKEEGEKKTENEKTNQDEDNQTTIEHNLLLSCYMGTPLKSVGTLMDGINLSLNEEVVKFSEKDGCDVLHNKVSTLSSLPKYLIVHLVRFEWKQKSQVSLTDAIKAKVCRRVNFERYMDVTNLCTEDLKRKLRSAKAYELNKEAKDTSENGIEVKVEDWYEMVPGEYGTGKYELISIVTHQGRTADAGHYICWTKENTEKKEKVKHNENMDEDPGEVKRDAKKKKDVDTWLKFDDDVVTEHDWGTFDLCGGRSDYHIAVLLLYKAQNITFERCDWKAVVLDKMAEKMEKTELKYNLEAD